MNKRALTVLIVLLMALASLGGAAYLLHARIAKQAVEESAAQEATLEQEAPAAAAVPEIQYPAWNTYHGDSTLEGVAACELPDKLELLWRFKTGAPVRGTPVSEGGRIFFATSSGEVIAVDFEAQRVWSRELFTGETLNGVAEKENIEAPVACFNGLVLVGTMRGMLYALDATSGDERWHTLLDEPILGTANFLPPAAAQPGGRVYVLGRTEGVLHCLDASTGGLLWHSDPIERCDGSPSASADVVVFGSCAAALHVFSPDTGKLLRNIEIDEDSQVAGGVAIDGRSAFSGCRSGKIIHADIDTGRMIWVNTSSESEAFATPAVTPEWVVACSSDGNVLGIERATGKLRWRFDTKGEPLSPVIANGKAVVAADGKLFLLSLSDGVLLWSFEVSDEITSPAVLSGMVVVGSEDGAMVAFGAGSKQEQERAGS